MHTCDNNCLIIVCIWVHSYVSSSVKCWLTLMKRFKKISILPKNLSFFSMAKIESLKPYASDHRHTICLKFYIWVEVIMINIKAHFKGKRFMMKFPASHLNLTVLLFYTLRTIVFFLISFFFVYHFYRYIYIYILYIYIYIIYDLLLYLHYTIVKCRILRWFTLSFITCYD